MPMRFQIWAIAFNTALKRIVQRLLLSPAFSQGWLLLIPSGQF
jgi:hypothetical protein